ncbi:MAG: hypothetical protein AAF541_00900 [Pseudomonadota bacterium]
MKGILAVGVWCSLSPVFHATAQEAGGGAVGVGQGDQTSPEVSESSSRGSHITTYVERGRALEAYEALTWFGADNAYWFVSSSARNQSVGNVLMVSSQDPNGTGHLPKLRFTLSQMGWYTHFLQLPEGVDHGAVFSSAVESLPVAERLFVVCEGPACFKIADAVSSAADPNAPASEGLVFINLPVEGYVGATPKAVKEQLQVFTKLGIASLILQEFPRQWPVQQPLAADVELHLLPRTSQLKKNSLILRKFRGWLKRRHQIG